MGIPDRESSNDHLRDTADQSSVPAPPTITGQLLKSVRLCLMGIICLMATLFFAVYYTLFYRHKNNPWLFCRVVSIPVLFVLGIKVKVRNIERLSAHQPCIILSNHQSNYDTFVTGRVLPQGFAATGKKDIKRIPIFGYIFYAAGNFLVDRENHDNAMATMRLVDHAIKNEGWSILFFPEGTRSHGSSRLRKFKKGAFHCAIETQVPMVPIAISSYVKALRLDRWRSAEVLIEVLEPISTVGLKHSDAEELVAKTYTMMYETIERLDHEVARQVKDI